MSAQHERAVVFFYSFKPMFESQPPSSEHYTAKSIFSLLLSELNQHHVSEGQIIYVDLSKLSNLGTYQEIGKGYDETATERNFYKQNTF